MINWGKIAEKCPKAWLDLRKYFNFAGKDDIDFLIDLEYGHSLRNLYEFFDELEIYVGVKAYDHETNIFFIADINGWWIAPANSTRIEAEEAAFTKAFELREKQLNK